MIDFIKRIFTKKVDIYDKLHDDIKELHKKVILLSEKVSKQNDDIQDFIKRWTEK